MLNLPPRPLLAARVFGWVATAIGQTQGAKRAAWSATALGVASPLLALSLAARSAMPALRRRLAMTGGWGRPIAGAMLTLIGLVMLAGLDRQAEAVLTAALPDGWTELITRF